MVVGFVQNGIDVDRVNGVDDQWNSTPIEQGVGWTILAKLVCEYMVQKIAAGLQEKPNLVPDRTQEWPWECCWCSTMLTVGKAVEVSASDDGSIVSDDGVRDPYDQHGKSDVSSREDGGLEDDLRNRVEEHWATDWLLMTREDQMNARAL